MLVHGRQRQPRPRRCHGIVVVVTQHSQTVVSSYKPQTLSRHQTSDTSTTTAAAAANLARLNPASCRPAPRGFDAGEHARVVASSSSCQRAHPHSALLGTQQAERDQAQIRLDTHAQLIECDRSRQLCSSQLWRVTDASRLLHVVGQLGRSVHARLLPEPAATFLPGDTGDGGRLVPRRDQQTNATAPTTTTTTTTTTPATSKSRGCCCCSVHSRRFC